ncbi:hypothetical protein C8R43DRAFT_951190 [Mycena crocata]|nr:hypothetical protein C8R43DRAFT_951187 [Mycena crocata]KAJ7151383.1 hypothetical protein C8R43DRAFT_951190 [Mycena crocata]
MSSSWRSRRAAAATAITKKTADRHIPVAKWSTSSSLTPCLLRLEAPCSGAKIVDRIYRVLANRPINNLFNETAAAQPKSPNYQRVQSKFDFWTSREPHLWHGTETTSSLPPQSFLRFDVFSTPIILEIFAAAESIPGF